MKNFEYLQPKSLVEAGDMLSAGEATAIPFAGGTDALGLMKDGVVAPARVVNLKTLPDLGAIRYVSGKGLHIGALASITAIHDHEEIARHYPVLTEAAGQVASPQLRNLGTLGGNLCQRPRCWYFRGDFHCIRKGGDVCYAYQGQNRYHCIVGGGPCYIVYPSDLAVALLALDASVVIATGNRSRTIPLADFYVLPQTDYRHENILKPGEILTAVQVPDPPPGTVSAYLKFKEREVWDFAMVSVAAVLQRNGATIKSGRLAFGGVAPAPWRDEALNRLLAGVSGDEKSLVKVAERAFTDAEPLAMNKYKVPLARNLTKRILSQLLA